MSTKKGLAEAEKRTRMNEIFLSGEFYTFKEIEKIAVQDKKIALQSVKDVLQSLVDDGLVSSDKIGTSIYYWAFPSDAKRSREAKIEELKQELQTLQQRQLDLQKAVEQRSGGLQDSDEREMMLKALSEKEATKQEKTRQLAKWKAADPRNVEERLHLANLYRTAINRLTENIFLLHKHLTREMGFDRDDVNKQFGINEEELDS